MDDLFLKACQNGQKSVVITFLKKGGINLDKRDSEGFASLHYACKRGTRDIVKLLVEHEADVTLASNQSITPLHQACYNNQSEVVKLMLKDSNTDVNAQSDSGETPLYIACPSGQSVYC